MSTRSQLRFVQRIDHETDDASTLRRAQVYRHSDGHPESVLPALAQLKALQDETGTERAPPYVAANLVFLGKLRRLGFYMTREGGLGGAVTPEDLVAAAMDNDVSGFAGLDQPQFLLGYGVEAPSTGIHGDEEYLYVVELPTDGRVGEPGRWTVKVSEHCGFPRWEGPTEEAFDRATWAFEGSLHQAVHELVSEPA